MSPDAPHPNDPRGSLPLLLLPGTLCDERLFAPLQQRLAGIETHVGAFTEATTLEQAAEAVLAKAPERFALLGFSLGGLVAMEVALQAPERVCGLALLSTTPFAVDPAHHAARRNAVLNAKEMGMRSFVRDHLWPSYRGASQASVDDAQVLSLLQEMAVTLGPAVFARQTEMALSREDMRPRLRALRCPTYVLAGAEDRVCPPDTQQALLGSLLSGALTLFRRAGHFVLLDEPDEVAASVAAWFHLMQSQAKEIE